MVITPEESVIAGPAMIPQSSQTIFTTTLTDKGLEVIT